MTHTNHRQGTRESLNKDYVVFMYGAKGINTKEIGHKLQEFVRLAQKHDPVNIGSPRLGNMYTSSADRIMAGLTTETKAYAVFDDRESAAALIKETKKADFGISIIVSGLFDEVKEIYRAAGGQPHTAQCSLGVWGKTEKLPEPEIQQITTMCGHAMVSTNLVRRMAFDIQAGKISVAKAAIVLAKPCVCGVFNPKRAEELLQQYIANAIS